MVGKNVFYNENKAVVYTSARNTRASYISGLVYKTGLVKTESGVRIVLLSIIVIAVVIIFLVLKSTGDSTNSGGNYDQMVQAYPDSFTEQ